MDVNILRGKSILTNIGDAYTGRLSVGDNVYVDGGLYLVYPSITNTTTTPTINMNLMGVKSILRSNGDDIKIGDIRVNSWLVLIYDVNLDAFLMISGEFEDQGVDTTDLTNAGGTITLIPGAQNKIQLITGSDTLGASYAFTFGGSPKDGDKFVFDYRATMTTGIYSITIAGIVLTAAQALAGNVWIEAYYDLDTTTWKSKLILTGTASENPKYTKTFADKAARDAAVPDFDGQLGTQLDIDAVFQSYGTSAGNWRDAAPVGRIIYADSTKGHTLAQGATGSRTNPFSTITEAITYAVTQTPSATNRYLVDATGTFDEAVTLKTYVDLNLNNSFVDRQSGAAYTFDDGNVATVCTIYGNAHIKRTTAGTLGCLRLQNASSDVKVFCEDFTTSTGHGIQVTNGSIYVKCKSIVTTFATGVGINVTTGTTEIYSNVSSSGSYGIKFSAGTNKYYGNVSETGNSSYAAYMEGTSVNYIYGNITNSGTTSSGALYCKDTSTTYVNGNLTVSGTTSTVLLATSAVGTGSTVYITGNLTNSANGNTLKLISSGGGLTSINITGNLFHTGTTTDVSLVDGGFGAGGNMKIIGDISGTSSQALVACGTSGLVTIYGNLNQLGTGRGFGQGVSTSGTDIYFTLHGDITCASGIPINGLTYLFGANSVITLRNSRVVTGGAVPLIDKSNVAFTMIVDDCTLVTAGTVSIESTGGAKVVKIYGASEANVAISANITTEVGSLTISSNVV